MKEKYKIEPSKYPDSEGTHIIFRYYETERGINYGRVFKGSKEQCKEKIKEFRNGNNKANI